MIIFRIWLVLEKSLIKSMVLMTSMYWIISNFLRKKEKYKKVDTSNWKGICIFKKYSYVFV